MAVQTKHILGSIVAAAAFAAAGYACFHHNEKPVETPLPDMTAQIAKSSAIVAANRAKPCGKDASLVVLRNPDMKCPAIK